MDLNLDEVHKLLNVVDLSRQWPELRSIHDEALNRLREIASKPGPRTPEADLRSQALDPDERRL